MQPFAGMAHQGGRPASNPMHIKIADASLPPQVEGSIKGELTVGLEALQWEPSFKSRPLHLQLRLKWWGQQPPGTIVPLHKTRGAGAAFPLRCGPTHLARYLRDMGTLTCSVEDCPGGRALGSVTVEVAHLSATAPLAAVAPVVSSSGQVLGRASMALRVDYSIVLSSFEMNEHLASNETSMALYPSPAKMQQPAAACQSSIPAGKENAAASPAWEQPAGEGSR